MSPCDDPTFFQSFSEASGPRFRKVAFNGTPLSDSKPQAEDETDQTLEESYIDALTLSLRHDTSDVYVPLPGGELTLSVMRSVEEEQWSTHYGLTPSQRVDQPFGPCWTSGLAAHVKLSWKDVQPVECESERPDPDYVFVVDETGTSHRFVLIWNKSGGTPASPYFMPIASNRSEKDAYLMQLRVTNPGAFPQNWNFEFTRKFGTRLLFEPAELMQTVRMNPGQDPPMWQYFAYSRMVKATDRMGNELNCTFSGLGTLIPQEISSGSRSITIQRSGQRIVSVTDPRGHQTGYNYASITFGNDIFNRLTSVNRPEGINILYNYNGDQELDTTPQPPPGPGQPQPPPQYFFHYNLSTVTDPLGRVTRFHYELDRSKQSFSTASGAGIWFIQPGLPRIVSQVDLPGNIQAQFSQNSAPLRVIFQPDPNDPTKKVASLSGTRSNVVIDAMGRQRVYNFSAPEFIDAKEFEELFFNTGSARKRFYLILWRQMTLHHPTSVVEDFRFNSQAGMALSRVEDYSGNVTTYQYEDGWSVDDVFPWLPAQLKNSPIFFTRYSDPTSQTNAQGRLKRFSYKSNDPTIPGGRVMTLIIDEEGRRTEYDVDANRGLRHAERVRSSGGALVKETLYSYGNSNFLSFITSVRVSNGTGSSDLVTNYTADSFGYRASENIGGLMTKSFDYDANGNQTEMTDGRGNTTTFEYDDANRLVKTTYEDGSFIDINYDAAGNKLQVTDENGNVTSFTYDQLNRLKTTTRQMDNGPSLVTENYYNDLGSKTSTKDPNGGITVFEYDLIERLVEVRDALNQATTQVYGANSGSSVFDVSGFKPTRITDPRGVQTNITYDTLYRKTQQSINYGLGVATTSYDYDDVGNPVSVTDPLNKVTSTTFDALNRPTRVNYADGTHIERTYVPAGMERRLTDELGRVTTNYYDNAGRLEKTVLPNPGSGSPEISRGYDAAGNLTSLTDANNHVTTYSYNNRNRRTKEELAAISRTFLTSYDDVGNVISTTDANSNTTTTEYDNVNRAIRVTNPDSGIMRTSYDRNGNILSVTDPVGAVTNNTYDALNRLKTTTTYPANGYSIVVSYAYDAVGNRTEQIDGNGCITRFTYDGLNRLRTTTHDFGTPRAAVETNVYNDVNRTRSITADNQSIDYLYDSRHRLVEEIVPSRVQDSRTRSYDDVGNLLAVSYAGQTWRNTSQEYDALNRVVIETSMGLSHTHTYDKAGNRLTTTYGKSGRLLTRTYDAGNRLLSNEDVLLGDPTRLISFTYDPQGNILVKTLPDGSTEIKIYDNRNRVKEFKVLQPDGVTTRLIITYQYDLMSNMTSMSEAYASSIPRRTLACAYDRTHRLAVEVEQRGPGTAPVLTYHTHDNANNRTQKSVYYGPNPGVTIYQIGNGNNGAGANQIISTTRPNGSVVTYTYNLSGSRVSRTDAGRTDSYEYDVWQRLLSLDHQTPVTPAQRGLFNYSYDARTRRVSRDELGVSTVLSFQGGLGIQEYAAIPGTAPGSLPTASVEFVRGEGLGGGVGGIFYSVRSGVASLAHSNARGDVVAKVNAATSAMTWQAQYEAYGTRLAEVGTNLDRQRANSKDEDPTGLLNEGYRYRDLETGTFISRDPAGFGDGPNLYTYVRQNPWTQWDPEGLFSWKSFGMGVLKGAAIAAVAVAVIAAAPVVLSAAAATAVTVAVVTVGVASTAVTATEVVSGRQVEISSSGVGLGRQLTDEERSEAGGSLVGGFIGGGLTAKFGAPKIRGMGNPKANDQALVDSLVANRASRVAEGTETGQATFSVAQSRGQTTVITESAKTAHAESQSAALARSGNAPVTIAVDQMPCLSCMTDIVSPLPSGSRVIVPARDSSSVISPKTAARDAARGKGSATSRTLIEKPYTQTPTPFAPLTDKDEK